jgi:hypothetical protein
MAQSVRFRRQASLNIANPSTRYTQQLSRGYIYREMVLRMNGQMTIPAAATDLATRATIGKGDEWSFIDRVEVIANGTDAIRSFRGSQLMALNRFLYGRYPRLAQAAGYFDNNARVASFDSTLVIPFWTPNAYRPLDTALDSSQLSDLRIEVTTSSQANVVASGVGVTSANLDICSLESFGVKGNFAGSRIYPIQAVVAGANNAFQVQLPVTSMYRGFLINAATTSATPDRGADLPNAITNVQLKSGTNVFRDIPWRILQDWQYLRTNSDRQFVQNIDWPTGTYAAPASVQANTAEFTNTGSSFLDARLSSNYHEDGWAYMDLANDGYLMESIDTLGLSELYLEFNVTAPCTITVIPQQIFPNRSAAPTQG